VKPFEIINTIEKIAPLANAAPWDNSGIQVAAVRGAVDHLVLMLDPAPLGIAAALKMEADMIVSHHPLAMTPRLPNVLDDFHAVLRLLFERDVLLYSAHTSLDAGLRGPASWLADAFGLTGRRALEYTADHPAGDPHYGFGIAGDLPEPLAYGAFTDKLAAALGKSAWRASGPKPETVSRMAYCPGSGESLVNAAAALGADIYITGDMKYHAALETPIRALDVGHFILEEVMMRTFADLLRALCAPVAVSYLEAADPFVFESTA
jgi:dinuclear metal center YbgI/SA1388 family protein